MPMVSVLKNVGPILITLIEASVDKKPVTQVLIGIRHKALGITRSP